MISTKLFTALSYSNSGNILNPLTDRNVSVKEDIESLLQYEKYLAWRSQFPVGYLLDQQIERNGRGPFNTDLSDMYEHEKTHIADPEDYVGTRPDSELRWVK